MTYTRHGHHIPNTSTNDERGGVDVSRCGGPLICQSCNLDAKHAQIDSPVANKKYEDTSGYADDPDRFLKAAKLFVVGARNSHVEDEGDELTVDDLYVVWWAYVLGNWKALISTSKPADGLYFEVSHNEQLQETYVDTYVKVSNDKFSQEG